MVLQEELADQAVAEEPVEPFGFRLEQSLEMPPLRFRLKVVVLPVALTSVAVPAAAVVLPCITVSPTVG